MQVQVRFRLLLAILMVLGVVTGCSKTDRQSASESAPHKSGTPVTSPAQDNETMCSHEGVKDLLTRFAEAVNEGNKAAVMQYFDSNLRWYSAPGIENANPTMVAVFSLEEFSDYLAERFHQNEELHFEKLDVNSQITPGLTRRVDFGFEVHRKADDLVSILGPDGTVVPGKGAVDCVQQKIWVLSIGGPIQPAAGN